MKNEIRKVTRTLLTLSTTGTLHGHLKAEKLFSGLTRRSPHRFGDPAHLVRSPRVRIAF